MQSLIKLIAHFAHSENRPTNLKIIKEALRANGYPDSFLNQLLKTDS